jgi:cytochrome c oxidase assembly factor CtaG
LETSLLRLVTDWDIPLERFPNSRALSGGVQGGFFLRKKSLDIVPSVYSNWRTAIGVTSTLVAVSVIYVRGWATQRRTRPGTLPVWRLFAFLSGIVAVFVAVASPLGTFSEILLTMRMARHFVLISVALPLIVIGALTNQIAAGAFIWVFASLVFVVPATVLTLRLLTSRRLVQPTIKLENARALAQ